MLTIYRHAFGLLPKPRGLDFKPQGWDMSIEAAIWALRLGFLSVKGEDAWSKEGEREISSISERIDHWALQGRCLKRRFFQRI